MSMDANDPLFSFTVMEDVLTASPRDFAVTPLATRSGKAYPYCRGFIPNDTGTITCTPVDNPVGVTVTLTVNQGQVYPIALRSITSATVMTNVKVGA